MLFGKSPNGDRELYEPLNVIKTDFLFCDYVFPAVRRPKNSTVQAI